MKKVGLFAAADLLEEGVEVLPLVLEEVHLLLPLLVVYRSTLALSLLDHLHLKGHVCAHRAGRLAISSKYYRT